MLVDMLCLKGAGLFISSPSPLHILPHPLVPPSPLPPHRIWLLYCNSLSLEKVPPLRATFSADASLGGSYVVKVRPGCMGGTLAGAHAWGLVKHGGGMSLSLWRVLHACRSPCVRKRSESTVSRQSRIPATSFAS